jgi:hypothetical protein
MLMETGAGAAVAPLNKRNNETRQNKDIEMFPESQGSSSVLRPAAPIHSGQRFRPRQPVV